MTQRAMRNWCLAYSTAYRGRTGWDRSFLNLRNVIYNLYNNFVIEQATLVFLLDHLSLVVSNSERNKMSAQALATVMGPPLMLHSASAQPGADIDHAQPIAVLKYLLQIWPQPQAQHQQMAQHMGGAAGAMMGGLVTAGSMSNMAGVASGNVLPASDWFPTPELPESPIPNT